MPVVIECTSCQRKLRVQDHLLGKTVKCPSCQVKFVAQAPPAEVAEQTMRTPVVPPLRPDSQPTGLALEPLEITEPASEPPAPLAATPVTPIVPPAAPAMPPAPPAPQLYESPPLHQLVIVAVIVLGASILGCGLGSLIGSRVESAAHELTSPASQP